jgi:hypothetical protein
MNPVFDGICYVRLHAFIMLMLGCNIFIPGMKAVKISAMRILQCQKIDPQVVYGKHQTVESRCGQ